MSRYLIWCFNDTRIEHKTTSEKEAKKFYEKAIKRGCYSSIVLRKEEKNHGYAIKSWSKDAGEVLLH